MLSFGDAMYKIFSARNNADLVMNLKANNHVIDKFSFSTFSQQWNGMVHQLTAYKDKNDTGVKNQTAIDDNTIPLQLQRTQPERAFLTRFGQSPRTRIIKAAQIIIMAVVVVWYCLYKAKALW